MAKNKSKKKWVQGMDMDKGAFTAKAESAGMTPAEYQAKVLADPSKYDSRTVQQANLRKTLVKMNPPQKKKRPKK
jgi:hypothetical protein